MRIGLLISIYSHFQRLQSFHEHSIDSAQPHLQLDPLCTTESILELLVPFATLVSETGTRNCAPLSVLNNEVPDCLQVMLAGADTFLDSSMGQRQTGDVACSGFESLRNAFCGLEVCGYRVCDLLERLELVGLAPDRVHIGDKALADFETERPRPKQGRQLLPC